MMYRRVVLRVVTVALLAAGVLLGGARPAAAHANLLGTEPGYGASVSPPLGRVLIRYDLPVEVRGAQLTLERAGKALKVGRPGYGSADRKDVSVPLPELGAGRYVLTWFLFGSDGDVMGGELAFTVLSTAGAAAVADAPPAGANGTRPSQQRAFAPLSRAQDAARLAASASLAVLLGGVTFVAALWPAGARLRRTRRLLWASLGVALLGNAAALGLKGAAVLGGSALNALSPAALTALNGTHVGRVLTARLAFFVLAVPVVALLTAAPERAVRSHRWWIGAAVAGLGALATHGMLSHAYARGLLASAVNVIHLAAVSVWLGGLAVLAAVVLPRRRHEELSLLVPRFSRLAFASVATAMVAGTALLVLISPRWAALPTSGYGRILLLKLALVGALLVMASRARNYVRQRFVAPTTPATVDLVSAEARAPVRLPVGVGAAAMGVRLATVEPPARPTRVPHPSEDLTVGSASLQPFVSAVMAELCIAASILTATALLVGRPPPT